MDYLKKQYEPELEMTYEEYDLKRTKMYSYILSAFVMLTAVISLNNTQELLNDIIYKLPFNKDLILTVVTSAICLWYLYDVNDKKNFDHFKQHFNGKSGRDELLILSIMTIGFIALYIIANLSGEVNESQRIITDAKETNFALTFFSIAIATPFIEETIFRSTLLTIASYLEYMINHKKVKVLYLNSCDIAKVRYKLNPNFNAVVKPGIVSSIIVTLVFVLLHEPINLIQFIGYLAPSIILMYIRYSTNLVLPCVLFHIVVNAVSLLD